MANNLDAEEPPTAIALYNYASRNHDNDSSSIHSERNDIKKLILSIACAAVAPFALAQTSSTTTTTTTTEGMGTITQYTPGQTVVVKETSGDRPYKFTKTTTYVTKSGKSLSEDEVRTRIKIGLPIHVKFVKQDNDMVVERVMIDD